MLLLDGMMCSFKGIDIALFSAGGSISKTLGPIAAAAGSIVSGTVLDHPLCTFRHLYIPWGKPRLPKVTFLC